MGGKAQCDARYHSSRGMVDNAGVWLSKLLLIQFQYNIKEFNVKIINLTLLTIL